MEENRASMGLLTSSGGFHPALQPTTPQISTRIMLWLSHFRDLSGRLSYSQLSSLLLRVPVPCATEAETSSAFTCLCLGLTRYISVRYTDVHAGVLALARPPRVYQSNSGCAWLGS